MKWCIVHVIDAAAGSRNCELCLEWAFVGVVSAAPSLPLYVRRYCVLVAGSTPVNVPHRTLIPTGYQCSPWDSHGCTCPHLIFSPLFKLMTFHSATSQRLQNVANLDGKPHGWRADSGWTSCDQPVAVKPQVEHSVPTTAGPHVEPQVPPEVSTEQHILAQFTG